MEKLKLDAESRVLQGEPTMSWKEEQGKFTILQGN
jgi:hypothetical protein